MLSDSDNSAPEWPAPSFYLFTDLMSRYQIGTRPSATAMPTRLGNIAQRIYTANKQTLRKTPTPPNTLWSIVPNAVGIPRCPPPPPPPPPTTTTTTTTTHPPTPPPPPPTHPEAWRKIWRVPTQWFPCYWRVNLATGIIPHVCPNPAARNDRTRYIDTQNLLLADRKIN